MAKRIQAVFKDGVLQPLENVPLKLQQVTLTITEPATVGLDVAGYFSPEEWSRAAQDDVTWKK